MKELSIEEKAKAYDKAIKMTKDALNDGTISSNPIAHLQNIFPELNKSDDERIRKKLISYFSAVKGFSTLEYNYGITNEEVVAWLEKQGEHANFRNKIQVGDKVTRNEDGVLVNISQLNRVTKKDEKQGEQNPWSEEDENRFTNLIFLVKCSKENDATKEGFIKFINRLKSLK